MEECTGDGWCMGGTAADIPDAGGDMGLSVVARITDALTLESLLLPLVLPIS